MYLINEQYGLAPVTAEVLLGFSDDLFHILFPRDRCVHLMKISRCRIGYDLGEGGLPHTRRAVQYDTAQPVRLYRTVQELVLSHNILLSDDLIECPRSHPCCQRCFFILLFTCHIFKQIHMSIIWAYTEFVNESSFSAKCAIIYGIVRVSHDILRSYTQNQR